MKYAVLVITYRGAEFSDTSESEEFDSFDEANTHKDELLAQFNKNGKECDLYITTKNRKFDATGSPSGVVKPVELQHFQFLGELKSFIELAEENGATDVTPVLNTGMGGMSARSEDGYTLCFDEYGYETEA